MNKKGQSVFEFLFFLPFMITLYVIVIKVGNSINGSINQQKFTRGYTYTLLLNDSNMFSSAWLASLVDFNVTSAGLFALGWATKLDGTSPVASCYSLPSLASAEVEEICEGEGGSKTTNFIRVKTAYGLCGENFYYTNGSYYKGNNLPGFSVRTSSESSCLNLK